MKILNRWQQRGYLILLSSLPTVALAFFCPHNFQQIASGASLEQVLQLCGQPKELNTFTKSNDASPQEWDYYVAQNVAANTFQSAQGTLKTSITFDSGGKAINISVNGIGVGATTLCGNSIQLGDSRDQVKAICGNPSFIQKQTDQGNGFFAQGTHTTVTELIYAGNPPKKLIFENGKLVRLE